MKYHYTYMLYGEKKYIGVRSSIVPPEQDTSYWGSSKHLPKNIREINTKLILAEFPTRKEAVEHEIQLHNFYEVGSNDMYYNRAKQTSTGFDTGGTKGFRHSAETIKKMINNHPHLCNTTKYNFYHSLHGDQYCTQHELYTKFKLSQSTLCGLTSGNCKSALGWVIVPEGSLPSDILNTINIYKKYRFFHINHGLIIDTMSNMYNNYDLINGSLSLICTNQRKQHVGWIIVPEDDEYGYYTWYLNHPKYIFVHPKYGEEWCTPKELTIKYNLLSTHIPKLINGTLHSINKWVLVGPNETNQEALDRVYPKYLFSHPTLGTFYGDKTSFMTTHDIPRSIVYNLIRNAQKTHKGWELLTPKSSQD